MPTPEYNVDDHHTLVEGEYTWVALQLQEKLRAMGYLKMDGPSTGYYGPQTAKAIAAFQQDHGLPATGEADIETQQRVLEG
jgi:peptidoglycan hydrolase-like protein with peptidoglycan-binding domain